LAALNSDCRGTRISRSFERRNHPDLTDLGLYRRQSQHKFAGIAREPSRKPDEVYDIVLSHAPQAIRRADLFSR
jgi:N6-adenosine-specific RNA methylase IME4